VCNLGQPYGPDCRLSRMGSVLTRSALGIVVIAIAVGGCTAAGEQFTSRPSSAATSKPPSAEAPQANVVTALHGPPAQQALQRLQALIGSHRTSNIVRVRDGYEAASWVAPQRQTIIFWRSTPDGQLWRELARRAYKNVVEKSCRPTIAAAALKHAPHATYVFYGCFTGDGVLNAEAFASGRHGWGLLVPAGQSRLLARRPDTLPRRLAGDAEYRWMTFQHGNLVTITGNYYFFPDGEDTRYPLIRRWVWSGGGLERVSDSQFIASAAQAPAAGVQELPIGRCPRNGTFSASFGARLNQNARYHSNQPLSLLVFPERTSYPVRPTCHAKVAPNTAMTVEAVHVPHGRYSLRSGPVTHQQWITAPAWLLLEDNGLVAGRIELWPHYFVQAGVSPYVVDSSLGVNEIRAVTGNPEPYSNKHGWEPKHRPASGTVTFHNGALTALSLAD
jgi:hypothetical protein